MCCAQSKGDSLIDILTRRMLVRYFYFSEALAIYELYYRPIVSTSTKAQQELTDPGRQEDRPPTWVPLVFHCTTADRIGSIISDGMLKLNTRGYVSFTELPIGELDRMKFRKYDAAQVAIGFLRRYIETLGLTPVWYLKHNTTATTALARLRQRTQVPMMCSHPS